MLPKLLPTGAWFLLGAVLVVAAALAGEAHEIASPTGQGALAPSLLDRKSVV